MVDPSTRWAALVILAVIAAVFTLVHRRQARGLVRLWILGWLFVLLYFAAGMVRSAAEFPPPWLADLALCSLQFGSICFLLGVSADPQRHVAVFEFALLALPSAIFAISALHGLDAVWLQVAAVLVAVYGPVVVMLRSHGALALHTTALSIALAVMGPWLAMSVLARNAVLPIVAGLVTAFVLSIFSVWLRYQRITVGVVTLSSGFALWAASLLYALHTGIELQTLDMPASLWHVPAFVTGIGLIVLTLEERSQGHLAHEAWLSSVNLELEQLSIHDTLTKVANRRYFYANIDRDISQSLRSYAQSSPQQSRRDVQFLIVDLDHFKRVNDTYGHAAGDAVLVEIARRLGTVIRASDMLIRWGGEEFLIVMSPSVSGQAAQQAERILEVVARQPFELAETELRVTCSVGWAAFPWHSKTPGKVSYEAVLLLADRALYVAKKDGRNRAVGFVSAGDATADAAADSHQPAEFPIEHLCSLGPAMQIEEN